MKVRSVTFAFVSSVFLAALGATSSSTFATSLSSNPLATQAYAALAGGDNDRAIILYTQAIETRELSPELLANSLLNRALAYQQLNNQTQAIDDYTAALALDAMSAELRATALYNRGISQQKLVAMTLAIEDFTSALLLNPSFSHAFYSRGNALRESGQLLFALSDFARALKFNHPDPARVYFSQAQAYELLQRPIDARRSLEAALAANPNFVLAREKLAALDAISPDGAQTAYADADQILTGSISLAGGNTLVHKPDLPPGVEPPAELLASWQTNLGVAKLDGVKKLYTDRVPQSDEQEFAAAPAAFVPEAEPEKIIEVTSVPEIPVATTKKPILDVEPEVTETAAIDPAPVAEVISGWSVQVASATSEDGAWSTWKNMQKKHQMLSLLKPVVVKADLGAKGIFYRVKITGFENQADAAARCSKLKGSGVACFIAKAG